MDEQTVLHKPAHDTGDDPVQKFVQILSGPRSASMVAGLSVVVGTCLFLMDQQPEQAKKISITLFRSSGRKVMVAIDGLGLGKERSLMIPIIFWQLLYRQTEAKVLKAQTDACQ